MPRPTRKLLRDFWRSANGNIAMIGALALPVLFAATGFGVEVASWQSERRALQSATDAAAIAAATTGGADYAVEAAAVAARYGYKHGVEGATVTASMASSCPGSSTCYQVIISKAQPLVLAQVAGVRGNATVNGAAALLLSAKASAIQAPTMREYCILALAGSGAGNGIRSNGSPNADLTGCKIVSNTNSTCNGHSLKADYSDAHGRSDGCGRRNTSNVPKVVDPYAALREHIPANPCSRYSWIPSKKNDDDLEPANQLFGTDSRRLIQICGDAKLIGDLTIRGDSHTVLAIYGGRLDVDRFKLKTEAGSTLTIIFTGPDIGQRAHIPTGTGEFDIQAPTTGDWKGVAIYQDPGLVGGVDLYEAGNSPAWKITGLVYMPHASLVFSGIVNKSSHGASCFGLVVDNIRMNGTAQIVAHGECPRAGLDLPQARVPARGALVS